jgi:hypothetical protein
MPFEKNDDLSQQHCKCLNNQNTGSNNTTNTTSSNEDSDSNNYHHIIVDTSSDTNNQEAIQTTSTSGKASNRHSTILRNILKNYIVRDVLIWLAFVLILPVFLFGVYHFAKYTAPVPPILMASIKQANRTDSVESSLEASLSRDEEPVDRNLKSMIFNFQSQNRPMRKVSLRKYENALCNDGTAANYYIRTASSEARSKSWIIMLEGGYFCYDAITCKQRAINSQNLTSSLGSKMFKMTEGILSSSSLENKYWSDVNAV